MPIEIKPNLRLLTLSPPPDPLYQGWERAAMTGWCRDSDALPKVADAGAVKELADGTRVQVMHNGLLVLEGGYFGQMTTEIVKSLRGHHEPQEEKVFAALLARLGERPEGPGRPLMIELGCYWAYYSLWFRKEFPAGRSILIEPDPGFKEVGRRNLVLNGVSAVILSAAVGAAPGEMDFVAESDGRARRTAVVSVDSLVETHKLPAIDILHADVQGAELQVLEGAERAIAAGKVRFVVLSTHHHQIAGDPLLHHRCGEWLRERGAHVIAEHTVTESFSGDGLIVASFAAEDRDLWVEISYNCPSRSLFRETEHDLAEAEERCRTLEAENAALRAELVKTPAGSFWSRKR